MGSIISTAGDIVDDNELTSRKQEYLDYISEHITNVLTAFNDYFVSLYVDNKPIPTTTVTTEEFRGAIQKLSKTIDQHDQSKYSNEEFDAYRMNFYPTTLEKTKLDPNYINDAFQAAWRHHYCSNPHHPEYWVNPETNTARDMELDAIIEMICDWQAMSIKFNNDIHDWYNSVGSKKNYSPATKEIVEDILANVIK